jgi:restriction system protein
MKVNENSLFAILLRSQWWVSALIAVAVVGALRFLMPTMYAIAAALPFIGIALYVVYRQLREPSGRRVARTLERLRALPWDEFAGEMASAYGREGYEVERLAGGQADLQLTRSGRTTLVACKRWKATRTGIEPLRELDAVRRAQEANECVYVAAGEITEQARAFAAQRNIRLLGGAELAKKLAGAG